MKDFIKGLAFGAAAGMVVGAIVVAKNKKLASKIKEGMSTAEEKLKEAKTNLEEKLESCNCEGESQNENCDCNGEDCDCTETFSQKDLNKKSKN